MADQTKELFTNYLNFYQESYNKTLENFDQYKDLNPFVSDQFMSLKKNDYLNPTLNSLNNAMFNWIKTIFTLKRKKL